MKVLIVGGGGREHAIIWKLKQSKRIDKIYCAPGNGGIASLAECVDIKAEDIEKLVDFAINEKIDLTVVGPEVPLSMGLADAFEEKGLRCFGPKKAAAEIESSKVFSKYLMKKYGIPTASYMEFSDPQKARDYIETLSFPTVIKADGLAAGKGVIIAQSLTEAIEAVHSIMEEKTFSDAGDRIIIEEFMEGPEVSVLAFVDGKTVKPMVSARDHKRIFDDDMGLNTGGMGTISPAPYYTAEMEKICMEEIFVPTIDAMNKEGRTFKGVVFFGLMLTKDGPKVVEYNCRFGDPETQVVLQRLKTDLVDIMDAVIDGTLSNINIEWDESAASCIVIASGGYPGSYEKGKVITGLDNMPSDVVVFHSGTKLQDGQIKTDGGRVLGVTAKGADYSVSSKKVYEVIDNISFEGMHYRKDIGVKKY
ncbi:phosphoribosylamine--glycine ligase [Oxobacter pfennigii]|uniref:Phosphoribosylamine--glycine ligase n=1 Tax=Oxobacter pfennigii TaxID=36849 RepID=A0A0P9AKR1_9CLOT|nr:phosphoribosylamine--glycine ligase [Oxobacter pfennigii]KPU45930.1 phosphoribosylamine--glycine ligase [Oxobacter pfennigii]